MGRTMRSLVVAVGLAVLLAAPAAAVPGWSAPARVVAALEPSAPSVALDANGALHVAYHEGYLDAPPGVFYATNEGGSWHKERVTTGGDGYARPSIALDGEGNVFIAFALLNCPDPSCESGTSRVNVATNKSGSWVAKPRTAGPADLAPSLVVKDGKLHVAFQRRTFPGFLGAASSGIWYATNSDGSWVSTQVASAEAKCYVDQFPSFALDASGRAFIGYERPRTPPDCGGFSAGIGLVTNESGSWVRSRISRESDDFGPSLALDRDGRPGVTFDRAGAGSSSLVGWRAAGRRPRRWPLAGRRLSLSTPTVTPALPTSPAGSGTRPSRAAHGCGRRCMPGRSTTARTAGRASW